MTRRYAPSMSAFQQTRGKVQDFKKRREALARQFEAKQNEMKKLSLTEGGGLLLDGFEDEFQTVLTQWLGGDPRDVAFSVRAHSELNQLLRWKALIEPEESKDAAGQ